MRVFPAWAELLGLDAVIAGIDFPLHAAPDAYRDAVRFIKADPLSMGALVTTHKIDLFDVVDPHAALMGETSCLSKDGPRLVCHAKDPISSGLAVDGFLPERHFADTGAELFAMGAGGSTIALTWHLMRRERGRDVPSRIVVSDRDPGRLDEIRRIHAGIASGVAVEYRLVEGVADNNALLGGLKPGSFVINATGLGKDRPGSPLGDGARFPERAIAWDLNYRGDLVFLDQARAQAEERGLQVEDGWTYFLHGWTQVIAEVFGVDIPPAGPRFNEIARVARDSAAT